MSMIIMAPIMVGASKNTKPTKPTKPTKTHKPKCKGGFYYNRTHIFTPDGKKGNSGMYFCNGRLIYQWKDGELI